MKQLKKIKVAIQLTNVILGFMAFTLFYLSVKIIIFINVLTNLL
jgi:hypothetical protein